MSKKITIEDFAVKAIRNLRYLLESIETNIDPENRYQYKSDPQTMRLLLENKYARNQFLDYLYSHANFLISTDDHFLCAFIFLSNDFKAVQDRPEIIKATLYALEREGPFISRIKSLLLRIRATISNQ